MTTVENVVDESGETKEICEHWLGKGIPKSYFKIYCDNCNKFGIIKSPCRGEVKCPKYWKKP